MPPLRRSSPLTFALALALAGAPAHPLAAEDDFAAFAQHVETRLLAGDPAAVELDLGLLLERSTRDIDAPSGFRSAFISGATKTGMSGQIGKQLAQMVKDGGTVKLLRLRSLERKPRALYRVLNDSGVNYLDLHLGHDAAGKVAIVDCYMFLAGETVSASMRRMYILAVADANRGLLDKLMGKEQEFLKNAPKLKEMGTLNQQKKFAQSLAVYDSLPPALKKEKIFLLARYQAASNLDDEKVYQTAIEDFEAAHPDDPALDLMAIDGHFLRKHYDAALKAVDRLDRRVHDPYLHFIRGNTYLQKEDRESARQAYSAAVKEEPTLTQPYWNLITLAMEDRNWKETARLLTAVEQDAGVALSDLATIPDYAAFVKTAEYRAWKKRRPPGKR